MADRYAVLLLSSRAGCRGDCRWWWLVPLAQRSYPSIVFGVGQGRTGELSLSSLGGSVEPWFHWAGFDGGVMQFASLLRVARLNWHG